MTLRAGHELGLTLALLIAMATLELQCHMPLVTWLMVCVPVFSAWLKLSGTSLSERLGTLLAFAGLMTAWGWAALHQYNQALDAAGMALMIIASARLLTRDKPTHDLQVILLGLMMMAAAAVSATGPAIGLGIGLFVMAATSSLITSELLLGATLAHSHNPQHGGFYQAQSRHDIVTGAFLGWVMGLSAGVLGVAALLFVLFPRGPAVLPSWMVKSGWSLPQKVGLSGPPRGQAPADVVARIGGLSETQFLTGLYARGMVYDVLDTHGFAQDENFNWGPPERAPSLMAQGPEVTYEVSLEPTAGDTLLTLGPTRPGGVVGVSPLLPPLHAVLDGRGELHAQDMGPVPQRYRVKGRLMLPHPHAASAARESSRHALMPRVRRQLLQLPNELDPRVVRLAERLTQGASEDSERVDRLKTYLFEHQRYTLAQPNGEAKDPLAAFLFYDPRGHCEYFAHALAVMMRVVNIPCRIVGGYQGGSWDREGARLVFTAAHAHVWVEWYAEGKGFFAEDATPPSTPSPLVGWAAWQERARRFWEDHVVSFGLAEQLTLARQFSAWFEPPAWRQKLSRLNGVSQHVSSSTFGIGTAAAFLSVFGLGLWLRRKRHSTTILGRELMRQLIRLSPVVPSPHLSLEEIYKNIVPQVLAEDGAAARQIHRAIFLYQQHRFGPGGHQNELMRTVARLRRLDLGPADSRRQAPSLWRRISRG